MSNAFVLIAIVLTSLLFTTLFSFGSGLIQITEEQTMRQIGTRGHAGLKNVTREQYEKITANPMVKEHSYNIFLGTATNPELAKRSTEIRYTEAKDLGYGFVSLKEGRLPEKENEILVDTAVMDLLGVPHELGAKLTLSYSFLDKTIEDTFTVCGWYVTDMIAGASEVYISQDYLDKISQGFTEEDFVKGYEENRIGAVLLQGTLMFAIPEILKKGFVPSLQKAGIPRRR
jgi:putative ABC transport system permease protein